MKLRQKPKSIICSLAASTHRYLFLCLKFIYQFNQNSWHFLFLAWKFARSLLLGTMCAQKYFFQKNVFLFSCLSHIKFVEVPKPSRVLHLVVCIGLYCELAHGKICETAAFFLKDMRKLGECSPLWLVREIGDGALLPSSA